MIKKDRLSEYLQRMEKWGRIHNFRRGIRLPDEGIKMDGMLNFERGKEEIKYVVEYKIHLAYQDIEWVIERIRRVPVKGRRIVIFAPYIRDRQADALIKAGFDYLDLAGNVHLKGKDFLVHVEGKRAEVRMEKIEGRAFQPAGLKVTYILLVLPEAIHWPYRKLAKTAGVAIRTAHLTLMDLTRQGYIAGKGQHREIIRRDELTGLWVQGYRAELRAKLHPACFQFRARTPDKLVDDLKDFFIRRKIPWAFTGAEAAYQLTDYYREEKIALFAREIPGDFCEELVCMPAEKGQIIILDYFCEAVAYKRPDGTPPVAHPLLVYAELMCQGTDRARETARVLSERYLAQE